jgi:phosphoglycolate phosphatase
LLVLFDIDGTLVQRASAEHAAALRAALQSVHGVPVAQGRPSIDAAGRTDGEIARIILLDAGIPAERIDELAGAVQAECCRLYEDLCPPDLSGKVVDGIPDVLDWLEGHDRVVMSLVTGNFELVARLKLARAGLGHWFPPGQGGFGSDAEDRTMLPPIARRRAGAVADGAGAVADGAGANSSHEAGRRRSIVRTSASYPRGRTIVIGDTPRDIACAHADGLRCVAVCSGPYDAAQLSEADAVARDSGELQQALGGLLAER